MCHICPFEYEAIASSQLAYLSIKSGNRVKQLAWPCPQVTKSTHQHLQSSLNYVF